MLWKQVLVLSLLTEILGEEKARKHYKLPPLDYRAEGKIWHICGKVVRTGDVWYLHQTTNENVDCLHLRNDAKVERNLDFDKQIHLFAKEEPGEGLSVVLAVSDKLYQMTRFVGEPREKLQLLLEYFNLRADIQNVIFQFQCNSRFRQSVSLFCGFVASNKVEHYYGICHNIEVLAQEFNENFLGKQNIQQIDHYLAETFLDMVGDELKINANAVSYTIFSWERFLAGYSLIRGFSFWQLAYNNLGEALLKKSEHSFIPVLYLTAVMLDYEADELARQLIRHGKGNKKEKASFYLINLARHKNLSNDSLNRIAKYLFLKETPDYLIQQLACLKNTKELDFFLKYITRTHGETYASLLGDMITEK